MKDPGNGCPVETSEMTKRSWSAHQYEALKIPLATLMAEHMEHCPSSKLTERKAAFKHFWDRFSSRPLGEINSDRLRSWFHEIQKERDLSNITLNHIKVNINHFFKWLMEKGYLDCNPLIPIKFTVNRLPKRERVILSEDELGLILKELKDFGNLYPLIYTFIHTGCRRGELLDLKWRQMDFANGLIHIRGGKTGRVRSIRMAERLRQVLLELDRCSDYVFARKGVKWSSTQYLVHLDGFRQNSQVTKRWTTHSIRHSFAYHFLKKGGNLYQLQAILGHRTIGMTIDLYGQLKADDVERHSPFDF